MNAVQDLPTGAVRELLGAPHAALVVADTKARLARLTHLNPTMVAVTASGPGHAGVRGAQGRPRPQARPDLRVDDLGADVSQAALHAHLRQLADDADVHGVVLELPLAAHLDADRALEHLSLAQDVEGLTPANLALMPPGVRPRRPCRPPRRRAGRCWRARWIWTAPASP
jgi:methylenetetrahydrofolate dehydrogenase (NADP+)/methenyltetrahydrofolate cyclohydrolase